MCVRSTDQAIHTRKAAYGKCAFKKMEFSPILMMDGAGKS